jgi:hypothetical protein
VPLQDRSTVAVAGNITAGGPFGVPGSPSVKHPSGVNCRNQAMAQVCAGCSPQSAVVCCGEGGLSVIAILQQSLGEIGCEDYFAPDMAPADSSRRQMDSPGAPMANIPSVAGWRKGVVRDAESSCSTVLSISRGPTVLPVIIGLPAIVSKASHQEIEQWATLLSASENLLCASTSISIPQR